MKIVNSLIFDVTYPMNIGGIARIFHVLGGKGKLYFYDPRKILESSYEEINRFSSDLFKQEKFEVINDIEVFLTSYKGRKIATEITSKATPLTDFVFQDNDLVLFGNERMGLSEEALSLCDNSVIVPMLGKPDIKKDYNPGMPIKGVGEYPSLSVSATYGIVMHSAMAQLGNFDDFKFGSWNK